MFDAHSHLLGKDQRLALLLFFGVTAAAAVLPFALWRFLNGQWLAATLDTTIVAGFSTAIRYAWRWRRIEIVALSIAVFVSCGIVVVAPYIGKLALFWGLPILLANLMLAGRKIGFGINLALIAGLVLSQHSGLSGLEEATFACSGFLVSLYGYVFALSADMQRNRLETLATYDELTGAGNRRMMERALGDAFAYARLHGTPCAVGVLDLDHFKAVNDTHGHEAGDLVLKSLVKLSKQVLRGNDRLYRMGGEEFVLLLPGTDAAGLAQILERIQAHLRPHLASPAGPVTVSIGAALLDRDDADWSDWLARADEALYAAKRAGRDQINISPQATPAEIPQRRASDPGNSVPQAPSTVPQGPA